MGLTSDGASAIGAVRGEGTAAPTAAGRKRAAVELIARHGAALKRVALRYSLCREDAEDAYQRTLEILIEKAPSDRGRELFGWSKTVIKHEALAIRRGRERLLGKTPPPGEGHEDEDWVALIPTGGDGPDEQLERREGVARGREALRALKPAELRALTLLAAGYSYVEIGEITGFSHTKINRVLAEGRERFRRLMSHSEDGTRCAEMGPLLSAFCDAETSTEQAAEVRAHLRACTSCRAVARSYRTTPATVAALAPALPASRSLLEKAQELLVGIHSRLPGAGGAADASAAQAVAAGGTKGAGMTALAKLLAVCAGTAGSAAACVATGVAPVPADLTPERQQEPAIERLAGDTLGTPPPPVEYEPVAAPKSQREQSEREPQGASSEPAGGRAEEDPAATGAVEFAEPEPEPVPTSLDPAPAYGGEPQGGSSGSAAGEFGP